MKKIFLFTILICFSFKQFSQENVDGKILFNENGKDYPVMGATVKLINTDKGTISNENGDFKLKRDSKTDLIVISYVGFQTDTLSAVSYTHLTLPTKRIV